MSFLAWWFPGRLLREVKSSQVKSSRGVKKKKEREKRCFPYKNDVEGQKVWSRPFWGFPEVAGLIALEVVFI